MLSIDPPFRDHIAFQTLYWDFSRHCAHYVRLVYHLASLDLRPPLHLQKIDSYIG